ncbi:glycosyltransferase family 4 protein [Bacteroides fragilis]|uniref:glycosyltransferase family 4 protein n=1 Tax=Bacteroides fragilis TaxID=817 RepID=UPI00044C1E90|nr:glycosyltransferase family 4 protein [Bacteroides fragilis]EXZ97599.1 glycosyl transferases group 1 family protein [Bacteroides fragilis str. S23 R14]MCS2587788.1 glycosyltransferase family 4 protein [Bacteroides fragilis]MCZ2590020.1 glycosyltransferase family 4 protein [Bacteroides fragilis]
MERLVLVYLGRRGAGPMYALEMARVLSKRFELLCFISESVDNYHLWKEEVNNKNFSWEVVSTYHSLMSFIFKSLFFIRYIKIVNKINSFAPDIVYSPMGHFWEKFIFPFLNCKCRVQTIHDVILHQGENSFKFKLVRWLFSYRSEKYVVLSSAFQSQLIDKGIDKKNIIVVPHAVFNIYNTDNTILNDKNRYNRFLFFGRIIKYKGLDVLLRSLEYVLKKNPTAKLLIAGNGDIREYKDLIERYKNNIELYNDWISDNQVQSFFMNIDFVVLPYVHASQSGIIPLAYGFGKPVIATRVGGLPEQIVENETGMLVTPGNETELADAILNLLGNDVQLEYMKRRCEEYIINLSWEDSADKLIAGLNE